MALTLTAKIQLQFTHTKAITGMSNGLAPSETFTKQLAYADGTAAGQANELYFGVRSLAGAASESLDLAAGALANLIGDTAITFLNIKGILVWLLSATDTLPDGTVGTAASSILVGNAANPFVGPSGGAGTRQVMNGGVDMWARNDVDGYVVTAGTGDLLKVLNQDAVVTAKYILAVWGDKT